MFAHFLRLSLHKAILLFISGLALYTVVLYGPPEWGLYISQVPDKPPCISGIRLDCRNYVVTSRTPPFHLEEPWPLNYTTYLFNPNDIREVNWDLGIEVQKGVDWTIGELKLQGSGVMTGDFGKSSVYERSSQVSDLIGEGWWLPHTLLLGLSFTLMLVATLQRRNRPRPYATFSAPIAIIRERSYYNRFRSFVT